MNGKRIATGPTPTAARTGRDWHDDASCRDDPTPDLWFPGDKEHNAIRAAKAVCDTCPVLKLCKAEAMADARLVGIWGGTTDEERRREREKLRRAKPPATWKHGTEYGHYYHLKLGEESCGPCTTEMQTASAKRNAKRRQKATA